MFSVSTAEDVPDNSSWLSRSWELLTGSSLTECGEPAGVAEAASAEWANRVHVSALGADVTVLESRRSGLQVYVAELDSPVVFGLWCVRLRGALLPTSLMYQLSQAMVEMGSYEFPHPGVLRQISFQTLTQVEPVYSFSSHIAFSVVALSEDGFLNSLPILADVLLFPDWSTLPETVKEPVRPTLFEHVCACIVDLARGDVGYAPNSRMSDHELRKQLQALHSKIFVPSEMCVIACGRVTPERLAQYLNPIDIKAATAFPLAVQKATAVNSTAVQEIARFWRTLQTSMEHDSTHHFIDLWGASPNNLLQLHAGRSLPSSPQASVLASGTTSPPSHGKSCTVLCLVWPGPAADQTREILFVRAMWQYLADGPSAPLRQALIRDPRLWDSNTGDLSQIDDIVEPYLVHGPPGFHGAIIRVEKRGCERLCADIVMSLLRAIGSNIAIDRMKKVLKNQRLTIVESLEESTGEKLGCDLMQLFLGGFADSPSTPMLNEEARLKDYLENILSSFELLPLDDDKASQQFWQSVLERIFTTHSPACVSLSKQGPNEDPDLENSQDTKAPSSALDEARMVTSILMENSPQLILAREEPGELSTEGSAAFTDVTSVDASAILGRSFLPLVTTSLLNDAGSVLERHCQVLEQPSGAGVSQPRVPSAEAPRGVLSDIQLTRSSQHLPSARPSHGHLVVSLDELPYAQFERELSCKCVCITSWPQDHCATVRVTTAGEVTSAESARVLDYLISKGLSFDETVASLPDQIQERNNLPFLFQMDCVATSFVEVSVWLDTSNIPDDLRLYLELYVEVVFSLPVSCPHTGELITVPNLTAQLREVTLPIDYDFLDLIHYISSIGTSRSNFICGTWAQSLCITLKAETNKYSQTVRWLQRLLFFSQFDAESIKVAGLKLLTDAQDNIKDPLSIAYALASLVNYEGSSNHAATNFITQMSFLGGVLHKLTTNPAVVVDALCQLRACLTTPDRLRVHVVCAPLSQVEPIKPWYSFVPPYAILPPRSHVPQPLSMLPQRPTTQHGRARLHARPNMLGVDTIPMVQSSALRSEESLLPRGKFLVVDCGAELDNCICVTSALDVSFLSDLLPALLVAMEYLATPQGELSKSLQQQNGIFPEIPLFGCDPEKGLMFFTLYGVQDALLCLETTRTTLDDLATGRVALDEAILHGVIHMLLLDVVERSASPSRAGFECLYNLFRGVHSNYNTAFARMLRSVTAEDVRKVILTHVLNLFDPIKALCVCVTGDVARMRHELRSRSVEILTLKDCIHKTAVFTEDSSDTCSTNDSEATSISCDRRHGQDSGWLVGYYNAFCQHARQPAVVHLVALSAAVAASTLFLIAQKKS